MLEIVFGHFPKKLRNFAFPKMFMCFRSSALDESGKVVLFWVAPSPQPGRVTIDEVERYFCFLKYFLFRNTWLNVALKPFCFHILKC